MRDALSVAEVAATLGLSRNGTWQAIRRGDLKVLRIGRRVLVPRTELDRVLNGGETWTKTAAQ